MTLRKLPFSLWAVGTLLAASVPEDRGAAGLWQSYKRAGHTARVLYVTAHPDDEDAGTLTWLARGYGADVTLFSITRGEGGANVITGDFFEALALLRELELKKAASYYGVHVRFSGFKDFGYSKNVDEMKKSANPEIKRMLGIEGDFGKMVNLDNNWAYNVIKLVGNYAESYDKNVGPNTPIGLSRGVNALWSKGGLQYAPPIR